MKSLVFLLQNSFRQQTKKNKNVPCITDLKVQQFLSPDILVLLDIERPIFPTN